MLLGQAILVAPVVSQGELDRAVYLPKGQRWASFWTGKVHEGGATISVPAPLGTPNFFLREGYGFPVNLAEQTFANPSDRRGFYLFPSSSSGELSISCVEDDGYTEAWRDGKQGRWEVRVNVVDQIARVDIGFGGDQEYFSDQLELRFPAAASYEYRFSNASQLKQWIDSGWVCFLLTINKG
jgi:alpha-glucosidase